MKERSETPCCYLYVRPLSKLGSQSKTKSTPSPKTEVWTFDWSVTVKSTTLLYSSTF